jgi:hypothetical protein
VEFASWLLETLTAFVRQELAEHLMTCWAPKGERRRVINGFVDGITGRISERLKKLSEPAPNTEVNSRALVVVKQAAVDAKLKEEDIKIRMVSLGCRQGDTSSYGAGSRAGDRASFGRPVSGRNGVLRLGGPS